MKKIFRSLAKQFSANNLKTIVRNFKEKPPSSGLQKASIYIQTILAAWALLITIKSEENEQKIKDLDKVINVLSEQSLLQRQEIAQLSVIARNSDEQQEKTDEQIQSLQIQTSLQAHQVHLITSRDKKEQVSDFIALRRIFSDLGSITPEESPIAFGPIDKWDKVQLFKAIYSTLKTEEKNGFLVKNREFAQQWRNLQSLLAINIRFLSSALENNEFNGEGKIRDENIEKLFEESYLQTIAQYDDFYSNFSRFLQDNDIVLW